MSLRQLAETDLGAILHDGVAGFGWPIQVTDPSGTVTPLTGFSTDISQLIDPDTGQAISGRVASVALYMRDLSEAGIGWPQNVPEKDSKPWLVRFDDLLGQTYTFKVTQSNPDRALGILTCLLTSYK